VENLNQGNRCISGIILKRAITAEGGGSIFLFSRQHGTLWASAPGCMRGKVRFGGSIEPLVFGRFQIYSSSSRTYLKSVDVKEDFWGIRKSPASLQRAFRWFSFVSDLLPVLTPDNELLKNLFWSLKLLEKGCHPELAEHRFLRRWCGIWGVDPGTTLRSNGGDDWYLSMKGVSCETFSAFLSENANMLRCLREAL